MRILLKNTLAYRLLKAEKQEGRLSHSYLLVFDDARNLSFALKEFAKIFFLSFEGDVEPDAFDRYYFSENVAEQYNRDGNTDAEKRICRLINENSFADCVLLPEPGKKFSVEDADKIADECALKPVEGDKKLFVIGDFAEATPQAQNKLLKLLEEPPKGVYFLLGATVAFPVLPTVLSRVEKLEIPPFSLKETAECLKRLYPQERAFSAYAAASGGVVGAAQNIIEGGYYDELTQKTLAIASADLFRLPFAVKEVADTKYKKDLIGLLRLVFRDVLLIKISTLSASRKKRRKSVSDDIGRDENDVEKDENNGSYGSYRKSGRPWERHIALKAEARTLQKISENYTLTALLYAQDALSDAEKEIRFNGVFPQCLEICMTKIYEKNRIM